MAKRFEVHLLRDGKSEGVWSRHKSLALAARKLDHLQSGRYGAQPAEIRDAFTGKTVEA